METIVSEHQIPEEETEELDDEEDDDEEIDEEEELDDDDEEQNLVGKRSGRGLTLKTLLKEKVLEPGEGNMTINYLGNKFKGDLLADGRIKSQETNKIFGTPSAWAIYCKKIVNPEKKSGCGWASVRYRGKKLDAYKNNWFRQKRLEFEKEEEEMEEEDDSCSDCDENEPQEQQILEFDQLGNKSPEHDSSAMIELSTFQSLGRMQPFNITMSSSAMAVIDVHSHLTSSEVIGYLAGQWDVNNHNLIVSHAFPVRCNLQDADKGSIVEQELFAEMTRLKLSLVGWYHTHAFAPPLPSLRDIDSQLDYEIKMKGYNDASYTPVLGIIVSPYQKTPLEKGLPHANGNASGFWVMPPPENKPLEYGRPMSMQFTIVQDAFIPKEALFHMSEVIAYYKDRSDAVTLSDWFDDKLTYWHKLKYSLRGRVPKDHLSPLIEYLTKLIDEKLPEDDPIPAPPVIERAKSEEKESEFLKDSNILISDFADIKNRSSPKIEEHKLEGKTPPKSYSPLFQLPLPPLFPIDGCKSKDSSSKTLSDRKSDSSSSDHFGMFEGGSKSDVLSELASKLRKKEASSSSRFLDLSMIGKESEKNKKEEKESNGSTWLAQAKMMQEALENPFSREVPQMFPPEFLTAQWSPSAAAAALHLARETYHPDVAGLFSQKADTSKPTYHSDVPLILKKQDDGSDDPIKQGEFRVPREVKDSRDARSPRKRELETRDTDAKDLRISKEPHRDARLSTCRDLPEESLKDSVGQQLPSSLEKRLSYKIDASTALAPSSSIGIPLEASRTLINLRDSSDLMRAPTAIPDEANSSLNELRKLIDSKNFGENLLEKNKETPSTLTESRALIFPVEDKESNYPDVSISSTDSEIRMPALIRDPPLSSHQVTESDDLIPTRNPEPNVTTSDHENDGRDEEEISLGTPYQESSGSLFKDSEEPMDFSS